MKTAGIFSINFRRVPELEAGLSGNARRAKTGCRRPFSRENLRKKISYLLIPAMVVFTFSNVFAGNYSRDAKVGTHLRGVHGGLSTLSAVSEKPTYPASDHDSINISDNPFKYSGYYQDAESGLYYLNARYYSPELMRFISRDTYDLSNRYAYCEGNPVGSTDPVAVIELFVPPVFELFVPL